MKQNHLRSPIARLTIAVMFAMAAAGALRAADLYVSTNGTDTGSRNSWDVAYTNLQDALNVATNGDTIHVAGQTFSLGPLFTRAGETGYGNTNHPYNSVFLWEGATNVTLIGGYEAQSGQSPGDPDPDLWPTLLMLNRAAGLGRVMAVRSASNCVIENITFTNGYLHQSYAPVTSVGGIGVLVENSRDVFLDRCRIVGNYDYRRSLRGGGIYVGNSTATLTNCWVINNKLDCWNQGAQGMGVYVAGSSRLNVFGSFVTGNNNGGANNACYGGGFAVASGGILDVQETAIRGNIAGVSSKAGYGGGIANFGTVSLRNVLIVGNRSVSANSGGGIYATGASSTTLVVNCTVADNLGGIGLQWDGAGSFAVTNSILWGNGVDSTGGVTLAWSCYSNSTDHVGGNNISTNPLFVNTTYYHLQSTAGNYTNGYFSGGGWGVSATDSPCLDAGEPYPGSDYAREPAPNGKRVNLGAYGNTEVASKTFTVTGTIIMIR
jgi:hypothetical protein